MAGTTNQLYLEQASKIFLEERDINIDHKNSDLEKLNWEKIEIKNNISYYFREIRSESIGTQRAAIIQESLVRFPSAPIYGINRKFKHQLELARTTTHNIRILRPTSLKPRFSPQEKVERIFILHNGLNETDRMGFYYKIAFHLLKTEPNNNWACIIAPFPGHLTRFPVESIYSEKPLDRYLNDPGDLFRQFLRYMIETKWLLSILVPIRNYQVNAGLNLAAEGGQGNLGRLNPSLLASEIKKHWERMKVYSMTKEQFPDGTPTENMISKDQVLCSINSIRHIIGWDPTTDGKNDILNEENLRPYINLVGYSLGGFVAQSIFFTYPYAISSCSTICSGGPLKDIALTKFAHHEEWQTVVNSIRDELQSAMIKGIYHPDSSGNIIGINREEFSYLSKIFNTIFLRDVPESYRARVSEYVDRLFFILGGQDPIIKASAVQDISPAEGIHSVQIAKLSHWVNDKTNEDWNLWWFPKVIADINSFSRRAEIKYLQNLKKNWPSNNVMHTEKNPNSKHRTTKTPFLEIKEEPLNYEQFDSCLDQMANEIQKGGWIFILRNDIPIALLGEDVIEFHARSLHQSDERIGISMKKLNFRKMQLEKYNKNVQIVLPKNIGDWSSRDLPTFPPTIETAVGKIPSLKIRKENYKRFLNFWNKPYGQLRFFDPNIPNKGCELEKIVCGNLGVKPKTIEIINTLPDVWIFMSKKFLNEINTTKKGNRIDRRKIFIDYCCKIATHNQYLKFNMGKKGDQIKKVPQDIRQAVKISTTGISSGSLQIIRVSRARYNPRFRGTRVLGAKEVQGYLIHSAIAYGRSTQKPLQKKA